MENVMVKDSSIIGNHMQIIVETLLYGNNPGSWKKNLEFFLHYFKDHMLVTLSLRGHIVSVKRVFDPSSTYNLCFPRLEIPTWFEPQSSMSQVGIHLPSNLSNNDNWMGIVICTAFSIHDYPDSIFSNLNSEESIKLLCHLRTDKHCLNPAPMYSITKEKFIWTHLYGFIWISYIPRLLLTELSVLSYMEARTYGNHLSLKVDKCGIRLLFKQDVGEFEKELIQCWTSFFENLDSIHEFVETGMNEEKNDANEGKTSGIHDKDQLRHEIPVLKGQHTKVSLSLYSLPLISHFFFCLFFSPIYRCLKVLLP